ncbi:uncharacterized protein LOC143183768 [Calliopsis andreniformis]|uniref:uncharacterized protein LOC143183768 n=1 Tax=Calliopsis andreniformis TaxID=337506 RepID=UPI003FCCC638
MTEENTEICGFLDIKYLGGKYKVQKVKKRALAPRKVWKRHWCSIKKLSPDLGIKVQLDYGISSTSTVSPNDQDNSIIVPLDAIVCRTQSRSKQFAFGIFRTKERKPLLYLAGNSEIESQRWITNIRQLLKPRRHQCESGSYNVSLIDNAHSKASGLTGLYGDLITNTIGILIKDISSGEVIETFEWKEFNQFHLITAGQPEDVKCICVIHTSKEFRGGIGELHMFCLEASKLLQDLVTQGRGPRNKINRRLLSLSEGDLRLSLCEEIRRNCTVVNRTELRMFNRNRESDIGREGMNSKIYNNVTEHVYQPEPDSVPNISGPNLGLSVPHDRRISDISVASGIYEEISDETESCKASTSNFYMDQFFHNRPSEEPPPLPPRQRCASESMKGARLHDIRISDRSIVSVTSNRHSIMGRRNEFTFNRIMDNCIYVPMSPRLRDIALGNLQTQASMQENDYVIMR